MYDDTFFAALLVYDNRWLTQVDCEPDGFVFHFSMEPWSYDELHAAYMSDEGQGVTDIRAYGASFKRIERLKGLAKRNHDRHWVDKAWQNGRRNREEEK